jgi:hypothetical protein
MARANLYAIGSGAHGRRGVSARRLPGSQRRMPDLLLSPPTHYGHSSTPHSFRDGDVLTASGLPPTGLADGFGRESEPYT